MSLLICNYESEKHHDTAARIWREGGWLGSEEKEQAFEFLMQSATGYMAGPRGAEECFVTTMPGSVRYLTNDLKLCAVTGVTTGLAGRRQGLAGITTTHAMAQAVEIGADVAMLGIFDQGYYDKLGFGTGSYERIVAFDPAHLKTNTRPRPPCRLSQDDWKAAHSARLTRLRAHGACNIDAPEYTRAEMSYYKNGFGLGYFEGDRLTHGFWGGIEGEHGPCEISWFSFRTSEEALELLCLLHSLSDQIYLVKTVEPPLIRIQDLLYTPFRSEKVTRNSKLQIEFESAAYWQIRMLNVASCIKKSPIIGMAPLRFNLRLTDPIVRYLGEFDCKWNGVAGEYCITLGEEPECQSGTKAGLPMLEASVGAFSRLWFGVAAANVIALSDDLSGPPELIEQLSLRLRLPQPNTVWEF